MPVSLIVRFVVFVAFLDAVCLCGFAFSQEAKTESPGAFDEWKTKPPQEIPRLSQKIVREFSGKNDAERKNVFNELCTLASDNELAPAVRYNAVLTIGQLDEKDTKPPVPYSPASAYLVKLYNDAKTPEYIQIGALLGIVRYAYSDISANTKTEIQNLFVQALSTKTEKGDDVAEWRQQTILDGLAGLKILNVEVAKALFVVIVDTDKPMAIRSRAVKVFGDLNYKDAQYNAASIGKNLEPFVIGVCSAEIEKINKLYYQDINVRGQREVDPREKKLAEKKKREALFTSLAADEKLLVEEIITETKMSLQSVVYAINGEQKDNSAGIISAFKADDANAKKLGESVTKIQALLKILDEGYPAPKAKDSTKKDDKKDKKDKNAPRDNAPKIFKLNLYQIKDLLVELSGKPAETFDIEDAESTGTDAEN